MTGRDGAAVGAAVAACAVCCAGPILAMMGAIGFGTVLGFVAFGIAGMLVALFAGLLIAAAARRTAQRDVTGAPVRLVSRPAKAEPEISQG